MNAGHIANAVAIAGANHNLSRNETILLLVIDELGDDILMTEIYRSVGHKSSYLRQSAYGLEAAGMLKRTDSANGGKPRRSVVQRIKLTAKGRTRVARVRAAIEADEVARV